MSPTKLLASAGAVALITTTTALAADFPAAMPTVRAPAAEVGGWYVRGDIGVGIQHFRSFEFSQTAGPAWPPTWRVDQRDIKDTFLSSPPGSAMRGTTGCASTSPGNIALA
jgi:opacity protein-like surface antigen